MTRREPAWSQQDRDAVLALIDWERTLCPGCGHPLDECLDGSEHQQSYVVGEQVCLACKAADDFDIRHPLTPPPDGKPRKPDRSRFVHRAAYTRTQAQALQARQHPTTE